MHNEMLKNINENFADIVETGTSCFCRNIKWKRKQPRSQQALLITFRTLIEPSSTKWALSRIDVWFFFVWFFLITNQQQFIKIRNNQSILLWNISSIMDIRLNIWRSYRRLAPPKGRNYAGKFQLSRARFAVHTTSQEWMRILMKNVIL